MKERIDPMLEGDPVAIAYDNFDRWTQRTSIFDGGGLTWIARIPFNIIFYIIGYIIVFTKEGINYLIKKSSKGAK